MPPEALILVDLEKGWMNPDSEYFIGDLSELITRTNKLIADSRSKGYKIIFIRHVEEDSQDAFKEGTKNTEILDGIDFQENDTLITKYRIGSFYKTDLEDELEGIKAIVVGGIMTNACVRSLIHDAYDRDFGITVIKDCCQTFDKETHEFTLKDIANTRPEVIFVDLEEVNSY